MMRLFLKKLNQSNLWYGEMISVAFLRWKPILLTSALIAMLGALYIISMPQKYLLTAIFEPAKYATIINGDGQIKLENIIPPSLMLRRLQSFKDYSGETQQACAPHDKPSNFLIGGLNWELKMYSQEAFFELSMKGSDPQSLLACSSLIMSDIFGMQERELSLRIQRLRDEVELNKKRIDEINKQLQGDPRLSASEELRSIYRENLILKNVIRHSQNYSAKLADEVIINPIHKSVIKITTLVFFISIFSIFLVVARGAVCRAIVSYLR